MYMYMMIVSFFKVNMMCEKKITTEEITNKNLLVYIQA